MKLVKVKDAEGFKRDVKTNAILNTDQQALMAYKAKKRQARDVEDLKNRMESLEDGMLNIQVLLEQLIRKDN
jgi:hypothetical protein